jgi:predicted phage terminase large subunit-like protein
MPLPVENRPNSPKPFSYGYERNESFSLDPRVLQGLRQKEIDEDARIEQNAKKAVGSLFNRTPASLEQAAPEKTFPRGTDDELSTDIPETEGSNSDLLLDQAVLDQVPLAKLIHAFRSGMIKAEDRMRLQSLIQPKLTKYIPHTPTVKQSAFLLLSNREAFYGGAAGGGKSDALLMAALQHVDIPGYRAILFRRTFADLSLPGALMDRTREWLAPFTETGEVRWNDREKTYHFPSGATLTFGYMEHLKDMYRYQGAEFQFIGFDELTQMLRRTYQYMFSRLRRLRHVKIPLRIRAASNPGGEGHEWVKDRYLIEGPEKGRIFIPAKMDDNPYLDAEEYEESLKELDPITRAQLRDGNWDVKVDGAMFDRTWIPVLDQLPPGRRYKFVRFWDLAATAPKRGKDPDWTSGSLVAMSEGQYFLCDIRRIQNVPGEVQRLVEHTASLDGKKVPIRMEQEPGSSGVNTIDTYARHVLPGYDFKGLRSSGEKKERARPMSAAAFNGNFFIIRGQWNSAFLDELEAFPFGTHDDQVDSTSGGFNELTVKTNIIHLPVAVGASGSYWEGV